MAGEFDDFDDHARHNPLAFDSRVGFQETGFAENAVASMATFVDQNLSVSRWLDPSRANSFAGFISGDGWGSVYSDRNDQIMQLRKDGVISDQEWAANTDKYHRKNWDNLASLVRDRGYDVESDEQVMGRVRERVRINQEQADRIHAQASGMGVLGQLAGTVWGAGVDPINVLGGVALSSRMMSGMSTLKKMAVIGGVSAASEAAIQPFVYDWKEDLGMDYDISDSLTAIAAAGGFGFALGGLTEGVAKLVGGALNKFDTKIKAEDLIDQVSTTGGLLKETKQKLRSSGMTKEEVDSIEDAAQFIDDLKGADPDGNVEAKDHAARLLNAERVMNDPNPRAVFDEKLAKSFDDQNMDKFDDTLDDMVKEMDIDLDEMQVTVALDEDNVVTMSAKQFMDEIDEDTAKVDQFMRCMRG